VRYSEGIFVGYRYYDKYEIEPMFCFGHGLSYTTFNYGEISTCLEHLNDGFSLRVDAEIENSGSVAGAEVVQLYLSPKNSEVTRPIQELRGFKKVFLGRGEKTRVNFSLDKTAFSCYDPSEKQWVCYKGHYELRLCSSSRDIRTVCDVYLGDTIKF
jgi:beta-glucosidase